MKLLWIRRLGKYAERKKSNTNNQEYFFHRVVKIKKHD